MSFIPYLHFDGQAEAAMRFYAGVFGAGDLHLVRYGAAPEGAGKPGAERIMYSQFTHAGGRLMASDHPEGSKAPPQAGVSVMHHGATVEAARAVFEALAEGGEVLMPFGATFFSRGFGMLRDRFGTTWMVNAPEE